MRPSDRPEFAKLIAGVYDFYGKTKDLSEFTLGVWWTALNGYELATIRDALGRHAVNPDSGQWLPKPADVVKMLAGSSQDAALVAFTKVENAVQRVGTYSTVAFDDPLIHRVIEDMGGWIPLGRITVDEWPFKRNEFVTRYRAYRARSETPPYLAKLAGIIDAQNTAAGFPASNEVKLIGDADRARAVLAGGGNASSLRVTDARPEPKRITA